MRYKKLTLKKANDLPLDIMVNEWLNWTYIDFGSKLKISALTFNAYMHAAYVYLCKIYGVGV